MNKVSVIRYLARYMRHPAMANSRIIGYGNNKVVIRMQDKFKRNYSAWFSVEDFIFRLTVHISPRQFRVVRWYGVYSRREVRLTREKIKQETMSENGEEKSRVFRCPYCKNCLRNVEFIVNKPPDRELCRRRLENWIALAS